MSDYIVGKHNSLFDKTTGRLIGFIDRNGNEQIIFGGQTLDDGFIGQLNPNNEVWSLGDSLCANGYSGPTTSRDSWWSDDNWLQWACVLSVGKLRWGGVAALGGITSGTCLSTYLPLVEAAKPRFCVVQVGTNDYGSTGYATDGSTTMGYIYTICIRLLKAGVLPVLTSDLPRNDRTAANSAIQQRLTIFRSRLARQLGIPFIDWSPQLFNTSGDGSWLSAAYSSDGTHMLGPASKVMGQSLLTGITPWMTPYDPYFAHVQNNSGFTSHLPCDTNALFLTDTNADGLADRLVLNTGSGTPTLSNMSASEGIGKWQTFTAAGAGNYQNTGAGNVAFVPGNKILLSLKFKTSGVEAAGGQYTIRLCDANSNPITQLVSWSRDVTLGAFVHEFRWPAAATVNSGKLEFKVQGTNAALSIGQPMLIDLSANGWA